MWLSNFRRCSYLLAAAAGLCSHVQMPKVRAAEIATHNRDANLRLTKDDIIVHDLKLNYGMGDANPVDSCLFYRDASAPDSFHIPRDKVSHLLPTVFQERVIRIYSRSSDVVTLAAIQRAFREYLRTFRYARIARSAKTSREMFEILAVSGMPYSLLLAAHIMYARSSPHHPNIALCRATVALTPDPSSRVFHSQVLTTDSSGLETDATGETAGMRAAVYTFGGHAADDYDFDREPAGASAAGGAGTAGASAPAATGIAKFVRFAGAPEPGSAAASQTAALAGGTGGAEVRLSQQGGLQLSASLPAVLPSRVPAVAVHGSHPSPARPRAMQSHSGPAHAHHAHLNGGSRSSVASDSDDGGHSSSRPAKRAATESARNAANAIAVGAAAGAGAAPSHIALQPLPGSQDAPLSALPTGDADVDDDADDSVQIVASAPAPAAAPAPAPAPIALSRSSSSGSTGAPKRQQVGIGAYFKPSQSSSQLHSQASAGGSVSAGSVEGSSGNVSDRPPLSQPAMTSLAAAASIRPGQSLRDRDGDRDAGSSLSQPASLGVTGKRQRS